MDRVSVVIPVHPPRLATSAFLEDCLGSVYKQTYHPTTVIVEVDHTREGAPATRTRGLEKVTTGWVAFLDSDDYFDPNHLELCLEFARSTGSDIVYPWYRVRGGTDPRPERFGVPFNPEGDCQTTITTVCRTELAQSLGFRTIGDLNGPLRQYAGEDADFIRRAVQAGATITHLPQITWTWTHHAGNTSGLPKNW